MKKRQLKFLAVMLCLAFGISSQVKADYVTSITSGNYYRIHSAYSGISNDVVMYAASDGMKYKVYDETTDATDGTMVFQINATGSKVKNFYAYNIQSIANNLYMKNALVQWTGNAGDWTIKTSTEPWNICIVPLVEDDLTTYTNLFLIQPVFQNTTFNQLCALNNSDLTAGAVRMNGWSGDNDGTVYNKFSNYNHTINTWYFEPVDESDVQAILAAIDPLNIALDYHLTAFNTMVSSDEVGYYVKANVDAFKAKYAECQTAYNGGSNSLTQAQKQAYADELNAAYNTAISARNTITDGYYVIKSAASAFGSNEYAMYIDDNGKVAWGAYNESLLGQFVFQLTDQNATIRPDGVTYEVFSFYSPYQKKYIGQCSSQTAQEPVSTSDDVWGVVSQMKSVLPEFTIQPLWSATLASYCIVIDNTGSTSGIVRTSGWFNNNGGHVSSWTFTKIDDTVAQNAIASMDVLNTALENYADAYTNLVSSDNPGFYVKANVDAFKAKYEEANTAYNNGSNSLTTAQKKAIATELSTLYTTATSATNPIEDNAYYNIVSAYPSGTKRALCIEEDGTFVWKDYDDTNSGQFAFKFTDQSLSWGNDSGTTSYAWAMQSALSGKYIGAGVGDGSGMNTDAAISDTPYNVCVTATKTPGQFILQPRRVNNSGFAQGLSVHDGGKVRQTVWCGTVLDGNVNGNWAFEKVETFAVVSDNAATIYAEGEVTAADIIAALDGLTYTAIDLSGVTLASGVAATDIAALQTGNMLVYLPASASFTGVNMVKDGVCPQLVLTDGQPFCAPTAFTATSATYNRTMTNEWGTICLPYEVSSNADAKYYSISAIENNTLVVTEEATLAAGTPALVQKVSGEGVTATATNAPVSATIAAPSGAVQMIGAYERTKVEDPDAYYIKDNKFWQCNNNFYCGAFRAYFTTGSAPANAFDILVADDDPTAIASTVIEGVATKAIAIYGTDGKKLATLQKGVNIVKLANGKTQKVVVK